MIITMDLDLFTGLIINVKEIKGSTLEELSLNQ